MLQVNEFVIYPESWRSGTDKAKSFHLSNSRHEISKTNVLLEVKGTTVENTKLFAFGLVCS